MNTLTPEQQKRASFAELTGFTMDLEHNQKKTPEQIQKLVKRAFAFKQAHEQKLLKIASTVRATLGLPEPTAPAAK